MTSVHEVIAALGAARFTVIREKDTQAEIDGHLRARLGDGQVSREHRLGSGDIPDFLIAGQIVVEVKLKAHNSKRAIYAQLERYARYPEVKTLILATNLAMGLPPLILGRPAFIVSLGAAWL